MAINMVAKVTVRAAIFNQAIQPVSGFIVCVLIFVFTAVPIYAKGLRIDPGLSLKLVYTDNANLSKSSKKGKFYRQLRPTLALELGQNNSRNVQLNLDYSMDYTEGLPGNRGRTVSHNVAAKMQAEVYRNMVFLDASAGAGLSPLRSGGQTGSNNIGDSESPVQTYTLTLSPYFKHHFGHYSDMLTRYTFDQVVNSGDASNSSSNSMLTTLTSGPYFPRIPWTLSYQQNKVDEQNGADDTEFSHINSNISYILNHKWRLNMALGKSSIDITSSRSSTDSMTWDVGATWTPSPRTILDVSYRERFHGQNFAFDFSHRWRRAAWTASYSKELTSWRTQQLIQRTSSFESDVLNNYALYQGNIYTYGHSYDDNGVTKHVYERNYDVTDLTDEYYVIDSFNTGFSLNTRRSVFGIDANFSKRKYEVSRASGRKYGVTVSLDRRVSRKTNADASISWQRNRSTEDGPEDTRFTINFAINQELSQYTNASLDYQYRRFSTDESADEYRENQLTLSLGTHW